MRERDAELADAAAAAALRDAQLQLHPVPRLGRPGGADSWCSCGNCAEMETEIMCFCCHECMRMEPLLREMEEEQTDDDDDVPLCIRSHEYFDGHLNAGVLDTYFRIPKVNWKRDNTPAGPNDTLSLE